MMKKGVMTVYFSLVFMLVMSFLLVLLESDRLYILRTEGERYADMAAEMVFAGYIQLWLIITVFRCEPWRKEQSA